MTRVSRPVLVFLLLPAFPALAQPARDDAETFFESKIRPVLAVTCFRCHGGKKTNNGLRVDTREALLKGGDSGPAVVPGDPENSLLVQAIGYADEDLQMPPDKRLSDSTVADFAQWVQRGAVWPANPANQASAFTTETHWAFEPV